MFTVNLWPTRVNDFWSLGLKKHTNNYVLQLSSIINDGISGTSNLPLKKREQWQRWSTLHLPLSRPKQGSAWPGNLSEQGLGAQLSQGSAAHWKTAPSLNGRELRNRGTSPQRTFWWFLAVVPLSFDDLQISWGQETSLGHTNRNIQPSRRLHAARRPGRWKREPQNGVTSSAGDLRNTPRDRFG